MADETGDQLQGHPVVGQQGDEAVSQLPRGPLPGVQSGGGEDAPEPAADVGRVQLGAGLGSEDQVVVGSPRSGESSRDPLPSAVLAQGLDAPFGQGQSATGLTGLGVPAGADRPPHHHVRRAHTAIAVEVDVAPAPPADDVDAGDRRHEVQQRRDRQQLGFGTPQNAAGLVAFLASDDAAGITGQAVGIGGDRLALWSHPSETVVELADGAGWTADTIADIWPAKFAAAQQTVGQQFAGPPTVRGVDS